MPANETQFDNVVEVTEQRIRGAVDDFRRKWNTESWKVKVYGVVGTPNFKVSITAPDDQDVRLLVANTPDAGKHIFDALETEHEKWHFRTAPLPPA